MNIESLLGQPPAMGSAIYIDMNSFFAAVEQEAHPELRGKPVGVCPFVSDTTCVIAASTEAKRFGVTTGTSIRRARQLCPGIRLIEDDPRLYRSYHRRIVTALETTRCQVVVKSIDEALLVPPGDLKPHAIVLAHHIKELIGQIGSQLGCSIGIASNMFLAKMGTKLYKPRGLVEVRNEDLEALYATMDLTDLYGVSWRLARRLTSLGIPHPLGLYHAPYELLKQALGVNGERWYLRLRGYEVDRRPTVRRTIGHQTTIVPHAATTRSEVLSVASQLAYKAAERLRAAGLAAQGVHVALRFTDRSYWTGDRHAHTSFWDSQSLFHHAEAALRKWQPSPSRPVRLVAVSAVNLLPMKAVTGQLFPQSLQEERLSYAMDTINARFGRHTISPALQMLSQQMADRVGFGNAPQTARELLANPTATS